MDFKQAKINWQDILKSSDSWILYSYYNWRKLITSDNTQNMDWIHWRNVSPTYARYRVITLEWICDRLWNQTEEINNIEYLQNLFALQDDLFWLEEKELYIKDVYNKEWILNVKIKEPLDIVEWDENLPWSYYKWRVVLESTTTPVYKSLHEIMTNGSEWNFWGFVLGFELWNGFAFNEIDSIIQCSTSWNISTSARIEITAINNINQSLKITNLSDNTFFGLDIDANPWDLIVIDSSNYTATKNGKNILFWRIQGSTWQKIKKDTKFIVEDKDGWILSQDFNVKIYFKNSLL